MNKLSNQECFDKVWDWFVVNRNPQSVKDNVCQYRGPNGTKCAAGVLIPDEDYDIGFEGFSVGGGNDSLNQYISNLVQDYNFLRKLQGIHDSWNGFIHVEFPGYMKTQLTSLAEQNNLQIPQ